MQHAPQEVNQRILNLISIEDTGFETDDFSGEDFYPSIQSGYSDKIIDEDSLIHYGRLILSTKIIILIWHIAIIR